MQQILQNGGVILWILLALSIVSLGTITEIQKREHELIIDKTEKYFINYEKKSEAITIEELKTVGITKVELNFYE